MTEEYPEHHSPSAMCCPKCGSSDLYLELGLYGGRVYHCKQCGYRGAFVIEWDEDAAPPASAPASGSWEEDDAGNARITLWVKIAALLLLLYVLYLRF